MEKPSASKTAAPAEKKPEPKGQAKSEAKAPGAGGGAPGGGGMGASAGLPAAPDPAAQLKQMLMGPVDEMLGVLEGLKQNLGGGKIGVELDNGDIIIPAAMVSKIPPALRQQFETCVGCSANDLVASKRGGQGQQKVSKGPQAPGQKPPGGDKPKEQKPSATKSASTSSASRA